MLKRYMLLAVATVFLAFQLFAGPVNAVNIDPAKRTVPLDNSGATETITQDALANGRSLFNSVCAKCHAGGDTKTNPTINLSAEALAGANPVRNTMEGMVDFSYNPTTYDGFEDISEVHPNLNSTDIYTDLAQVSAEDIHDIAGYILVQPNILGDQWGGGKTTR